MAPERFAPGQITTLIPRRRFAGILCGGVLKGSGGRERAGSQFSSLLSLSSLVSSPPLHSPSPSAAVLMDLQQVLETRGRREWGWGKTRSLLLDPPALSRKRGGREGRYNSHHMVVVVLPLLLVSLKLPRERGRWRDRGWMEEGESMK